jgi:hypothetical protein
MRSAFLQTLNQNSMNFDTCVCRRENSVRQELYSSYAKQRGKVATAFADKERQSEYEFDFLFGPDHTTEVLYNICVRRLVLAAMDGFHGSVFAYGQTSTGKTHTMQGTSTEPGIIPQAIYECFSYVESCPTREFLFRVSYLEVRI